MQRCVTDSSRASRPCLWTVNFLCASATCGHLKGEVLTLKSLSGEKSVVVWRNEICSCWFATYTLTIRFVGPFDHLTQDHVMVLDVLGVSLYTLRGLPLKYVPANSLAKKFPPPLLPSLPIHEKVSDACDHWPWTLRIQLYSGRHVTRLNLAAHHQRGFAVPVRGGFVYFH